MARMFLPPGFRFHPTDDELMRYYLKRQVMGKKSAFDAVTELNIYQYSPWDLPDKCLLKSRDLKWYFFCPREPKYTTGARANRATKTGFWKATGKDRCVTYKQRTIGMIKTLIFHKGHAPKGERTDWVMHEYRLKDEELVDVVQDAYVLCRIFQKKGLGPQNGAQYGAPFNEDEWNDIEEESQTFVNNVPQSSILNSDAINLPVPVNSLVSYVPEPDPLSEGPQNIDMQPIMKEVCVVSSAVESHMLPNYVPPGIIGSSAATHMIPGNSNMWSTSGPSAPGPLDTGMPILLNPDSDVLASLDMFTEDINMLPVERKEKSDLSGQLPQLHENDIYDIIGDLDDWIELGDTGLNISSYHDADYDLNPVLMGEEAPFLELNDLRTPIRCPPEDVDVDRMWTDRGYTAPTHDMSIGLDKCYSEGANGLNISSYHDADYNLNPVLMGEEAPFLELNDLRTPIRCPPEAVDLDWMWTNRGYTAPTHDMSIGLDKYYSEGANICSVEKVSGWNENAPLLGSQLGNNSENLWKDNCIGNFEARGFDAVMGNEGPSSTMEPEDNCTEKQIQRRGSY
ncbi:NAC domain-containing protein 82 isoform X2 [Daucus carota subsp. sativus]|nr:PREDICTED: NAC domain-containing protein 82 isoform X3 [Daucus carota subsp. sativus]